VKLIVSQAAQADLLRLHAFLTHKNPDAAQRAVSAIVRAIDSLDLFPDRGKPSAVASARELIVPFGQSAYVVRYVHDAEREELVVLRVWHSRESLEDQ
jgi:plasmid stabilization system protein ParE